MRIVVLMMGIVLASLLWAACDHKPATPPNSGPVGKPASGNGAAPAVPAPPAASAQSSGTKPSASEQANSKLIADSENLLHIATTYTYQKKFDLAEATFRKLETVMTSLPASLQEEIKAARSQLAQARAAIHRRRPRGTPRRR